MSALINVLLIEDDEVNSFYTQYLLKKTGRINQIYSVLNGQLALDKLESLANEEIHVDLILLDINMPVMNGFEFLDVFQEKWDESEMNTKVVLISSSEHTKDFERAKMYRCVKNYLYKADFAEKLNLILN